MKQRILFDLIHSHLQNPLEHRLSWQEYEYDHICAPARIFDHLVQNGYTVDGIKEGEITYDLLKDYDILYINLLNQEDPPFTEGEFEAMKKFVSPPKGGSIFIIAEHTNCYYHAERLNPFLEQFGIFIEYTSALDSPENCVDPFGWISVSNFDKSHPTNDGIERISFQLGGTLKTNHGTAFLSKYGFGDYWNPALPPSFVGDKWKTLDDSKEPTGALQLVACIEDIGGKGGGKIAVVADQNIYGDVWAHYYDNFRHALNIFEWLSNKSRKNNPPLRDILPKGFNLGVDSYFSANSAGRAASNDFYSFYVNFNRDDGMSAHAIYDPHLKSKRWNEMDGYLFFPLMRKIQDYSFFQKTKKPICILFDVRSITGETFDLLSKIAPDLTISIERDPKIYGFKPEDKEETILNLKRALRFNMTAGLVSSKLQLPGVQLVGYNLATISSTWGSPLVQTTTKAPYDIARIKDNLIIFFQVEMFCNAYLGSNEARKPPEIQMNAVKLQHSLIQFLKTYKQ